MSILILNGYFPSSGQRKNFSAKIAKITLWHYLIILGVLAVEEK